MQQTVYLICIKMLKLSLPALSSWYNAFQEWKRRLQGSKHFRCERDWRERNVQLDREGVGLRSKNSMAECSALYWSDTMEQTTGENWLTLSKNSYVGDTVALPVCTLPFWSKPPLLCLKQPVVLGLPGLFFLLSFSSFIQRSSYVLKWDVCFCMACHQEF